MSHVYSYSPWVYLQVEPMIHPARVVADYVALEGVIRGEPNGLGWPSGGPPPSEGLCATAGPGTRMEYFFDAEPQWRHYRVEAPGATPTLVGIWDGTGAPPGVGAAARGVPRALYGASGADWPSP